MMRFSRFYFVCVFLLGISLSSVFAASSSEISGAVPCQKLMGYIAASEEVGGRMAALLPKGPNAASSSELAKDELFVPTILAALAKNPKIREAAEKLLSGFEGELTQERFDKIVGAAHALRENEGFKKFLSEYEVEIEKYSNFHNPKKVGIFGKAKKILSSLVSLPRTLWEMHRVVKENYTPEILDANLWALVGFHQMSRTDPYYRQRPWEKASPTEIRPDQVERMTPEEFAAFAYMAMEIEAPILQYSLETGEGIRFLVDRVARWFGQNKEQSDYAREHDLPFCAGPWCKEEQRHTPAFRKIVRQLLGFTPAVDNPSEAGGAPIVGEAASVEHLISRQHTEWSASSAYVFLAGHSSGMLKNVVQNIMRDEVKHLAILGAGDQYLFGKRPWNRFKDLVKAGLKQLSYHGETRTTSSSFLSNPVSVIELLGAHLISEFYIRKWLKTLPHATLQRIFETDSNVYEIPAFKPGPQRQAEIDQSLARGKEIRLNLSRWPEGQRKAELLKREFMEKHGEALNVFIAENLSGFQGSEIYGSPENKAMLAKISALSASDLPEMLRSELSMVKLVLPEKLREHQIANNWYIRDRNAGKVRLGKPLTGDSEAE